MKKNLATSACVFILSCVLYAQAAKLPPPRFEALGPAFLPKAVIGSIAFLCLLDMLVTVIRANRNLAAGREAEAAAERPGPLFTIVLPVLSVLYFVTYVLIVEYTDISYLLLTFIYLILGMWTLSLFDRRTLLPIICTAAGVTGAIHVIFHLCLEIILP